MAWFWLNVPLGALIFLAVAGIPMWLVIKRPDTGPGSAAERRAAYRRSAPAPLLRLPVMRLRARSAAGPGRAGLRASSPAGMSWPARQATSEPAAR
jgi:hypothetical protein